MAWVGLFIAGWIAAPSARAADDLQRFTYSEVHMGMEARITLYATSQAKAEEACIAAFKRIGELDAIMSDYRRDSELNLLCAKAGGEPVPVSADLFR
ncbi:MAG: FAD:protein FMN transferase, partial [Nitrospirae bacterium]|nr:FAD:protein FMN transferase [Fimbriimonadaceae bacterium]